MVRAHAADPVARRAHVGAGVLLLHVGDPEDGALVGLDQGRMRILGILERRENLTSKAYLGIYCNGFSPKKHFSIIPLIKDGTLKAEMQLLSLL